MYCLVCTFIDQIASQSLHPRVYECVFDGLMFISFCKVCMEGSSSSSSVVMTVEVALLSCATYPKSSYSCCHA